MRIGIDANAYYKNAAGSGVYSKNIVDRWISAGQHAVYLFASPRRSQTNPVKNVRLLHRLVNGIFDILWTQVVLPYRLKKENIDILFAPAYVSPLWSPCPVVLGILDMSMFRHPETCDAMFSLYVKTLLAFTKRSAACILTISEFSKKEIRDLLCVESEAIKVVYLGAHDRYRPVGDDTTLTALKTKYKTGDAFILHVGTLEPRKNIVSLVKAFALLKKKAAIAHKLVLCGGKGCHGEHIDSEVKALGIEDEVVFTGYVPEEELPLFYRAADVLVFPSLYEGFGLPVLEAMACGCPVVCSGFASLPEVAGDAAFLVDSRDPRAIAEAVVTILNDEPFKNELVKKGLARSAQFSWETAAGQTMDILNEVWASTYKHRSSRKPRSLR